MVAIVLSLLAAACGGDGDDLGKARRILDDESRFSTGLDAGEAFEEVGDLLLADARSCEDACDGRFSAAAFARVLALRVLGCTAPGRLEARVAMARYLDDISEEREEPEAPGVPECPLGTPDST